MPIYKVAGEKKDGKQKYLVRLNYQDSYGKARQLTRTAYGSEEAKQLERELSYQIKIEKPSKKLSLSELKDEYIKNKKHEVRETSLDKSDRILKRYVLTDKLKNMKIDKLTVPILQEWKTELNNTDLSTVSKQNIFGEFRALLNYAVKMEYIPKNNLVKVGTFKAPLEKKKEMLFYTPDEFKKYIIQAKMFAEEQEQQGSLYGWNVYIFFMIAFYMGMRKGEIHALTWSDIDFTKHIINITKSLAQKLSGGDRITPPKNASSIRSIEMPEPLENALKKHYNRCKSIENFNDSFFVCGGTKALRDSSLNKINHKLADRAEVKRIRIHDFRHSHASLLANEGINIQEVAKRLGHSKIDMTWNRYSHLYPRESERALKVLNKIDINSCKNRVKQK